MRNITRGSNVLLDLLPEQDRRKLLPHLTRIDLRSGTILVEPYTPLKHAYFPCDSMVSLLSLTSDGTSVEVATVGSEGLIGVAALLQAKSIPYQAVVQSGGGASRIEIDKLKTLFDERVSLRRVVLRYLHALMTQTAQSAVCNRFHSVEQRLARWILSSRDRTHRKSFGYTQEFLSHMLGTDRSSTTLAAGMLKRAGLIQYTRGTIRILDSKGLEQVVCECYHLVKREFEDISG
jgi:CRP-like cAMP-binding protein